MSDGLNFGRRVRSPAGPRIRVMAAVLALSAGGVVLVRSRTAAPEAAAVAEQVVEVQGDVPRPGFHRVPEPVTVASAVAAAGGSSEDATSVPPGSRVVVAGETASIQSMENTLVVGVPVDLNQASKAAFEALPGIGPARAEAIVAERQSGGRYTSVDDLTRVKGIGPATVDALRPFVVVRAP